MQRIHNRMPVILPADLVGQWLDPAIDNAETIAQMLRPASDNALRAYEVSTWVNSPGHDDEGCWFGAEESDTRRLWQDRGDNESHELRR